MASAVDPLPAAIRVAALMRAQSLRKSPSSAMLPCAPLKKEALRPQAVLLRGAGGAAMAARIQAAAESRGRACRVFHARPGEAESASPERILLPVLRALSRRVPLVVLVLPRPDSAAPCCAAAAVAQGYRLREWRCDGDGQENYGDGDHGEKRGTKPNK